MGGQKSKIVNPKANVINEVEIVEADSSIKIYLIIIIGIMALQFATTIYQLHKRSIKKSYARSASIANDLNKV